MSDEVGLELRENDFRKKFRLCNLSEHGRRRMHVLPGEGSDLDRGLSRKPRIWDIVKM